MSDSSNNSGILKIIAVLSAIVGLIAVMLTCTKNGLEVAKSGIDVTKELSNLSVDKQNISKSDNNNQDYTPVDHPKVIPNEEIIPSDRPNVISNEIINLTGTWTDNVSSYEIEQDDSQVDITIFGHLFTGKIEGKKGTVTGTGFWGQQVDMNFRIKNKNTVIFKYTDLSGNPASFTLSKKIQE